MSAGTTTPTVQADVEPVRKVSGGPWHCPWPGCPDQRTPGARHTAREHAREPHVRCSCGRHFAARSLRAHLGQVKRRGIEHPPAPEIETEGEA